MRFGALPVPAVLLVASLSSCSPEGGSPCDTSKYRCYDLNTALECRDDVWREIPCRGPDGCASAEGSIECDVTLNRADDACAQSHEGKSICHSGGKALLECRGGVWVQSRTCSACVLVGPDGIDCAE